MKWGINIMCNNILGWVRMKSTQNLKHTNQRSFFQTKYLKVAQDYRVVEILRKCVSITCCFKVGKSKSCRKKPKNGKFNLFLHHSINCECWFYKSFFAMILPTLPIWNRVDCLAQIIKTRVNSLEVSLEGAVILIEFVITIT